MRAGIELASHVIKTGTTGDSLAETRRNYIAMILSTREQN